MNEQQRLVSGHLVEGMPGDRYKKMASFNSGMVRVLPDGFLYPGTAPRFLDKIQTLKFRPDDIMVMTFPKSGTTWMQEIVWTMVHNPNLDNPIADRPLLLRSIDISADMVMDSSKVDEVNPESFFADFQRLCPGKNAEDGLSVQCFEAQPGRRVCKCHFPLDLMPSTLLDQAKVIYVARNPKDMALSFYYFCQVLKIFDYNDAWESFVKQFMDDDIIYCPYWPHVKQAWRQRNHPNLHFVLYEDMKADPLAEINKLNTFLNTNLTQEQLKKIVEYTSFSAMKSRGEPVADKGLFKAEQQQKSGGYFRKGETGGWKKQMTPEINQAMDKWIQQNLGDSGIQLKWE